MRAHPILSRDVIDRMVVTALRMDVPLDWSEPAGKTISVFAREVIGVEKESRDLDALPPICWFQGGPGFESPFPESRSGWLEQLLTRYRVVLLDQRGTGLSTPLDARALPRDDPRELAAYLSHFRADAIVRDADHMRALLYGSDAAWHIFGQSFGGFCALTYLSFLPEHLGAAIITGGFAPVAIDTAEAVYAVLIERIADRNAAYFRRFRGDVERVRRIVDHLQAHQELDAHGEPLTARRFLALGEVLGHGHGQAELHAVIDRAAADLDALGTLSGAVHNRIGALMSPATNPIYSVLHEPCYAQEQATGWGAQRVVARDPRFALDANPSPYFTGEMIFPWMFEDLAALRPLKAVADVLAELDRWPRLYDIDRLKSNTVPVVGTVYWHDLYVDRTLATETAQLLGNCDVWITNEYEHGAYRLDPKRVGSRLFAMLDQRRAEG